MILLAFFFPLALYLLVLGQLNRRRTPLLVSGVWDGIALLGGVSGFLLLAGPAVFSALNERWRIYWLLGRGGTALAVPEGEGRLWIFFSLFYFFLIVGGAAFYLRRQLPLTAIYNTDAARIEHVLTLLFARLGLHPVRSGDLFLFGFASSTEPSSAPSAILEIDSFPLMRHVTLRWEPTDSPLRSILERELASELAETLADDHELSGWLLLMGFLLLAFEFVGSILLILFNLTSR